MSSSIGEGIGIFWHSQHRISKFSRSHFMPVKIFAVCTITAGFGTGRLNPVKPDLEPSRFGFSGR